MAKMRSDFNTLVDKIKVVESYNLRTYDLPYFYLKFFNCNNRACTVCPSSYTWVFKSNGIDFNLDGFDPDNIGKRIPFELLKRVDMEKMADNYSIESQEIEKLFTERQNIIDSFMKIAKTLSSENFNF